MPPTNNPCVVLVPVGHRIDPQVESSLRELERRGYAVWRSYGCSAIDFARSRLATQALAQGFRETLWIDADVQFDPDEVERMRAVTWDELRAALDVDASRITPGDLVGTRPGVVTGVYVKKGVRELALTFAGDSNLYRFGRDATFAPVRFAPCGMLLVRDWVYREVAARCQLPRCHSQEPCGVVPYFLPLVVTDGANSAYLCEDFAFSHRVRQCGLSIWADLRMRLFHHGNYPYGWEDAGKDVERYANYRFTLKRKEPT